MKRWPARQWFAKWCGLAVLVLLGGIWALPTFVRGIESNNLNRIPMPVPTSTATGTATSARARLRQAMTEYLQQESQPKSLTEADLVRLETELDDPAKRLAAIAQLAAFGWPKLYQVGSVIYVNSDPIQDRLQKRAADLAARHTDSATVRGALASPDFELQRWGIWFWQGGLYNAMRAAKHVPLTLRAFPLQLTEDEKIWTDMVPLLKRLAAADSLWRVQALDALGACSFVPLKDFFLGLIPEETEPMVILHLIKLTEPGTRPNQRPPTLDCRFNKELLRLLDSPEREVRHSALSMIGGNWQRPEMWRVEFSTKLAARVEEFRHSADPEERKDAEWALNGLKKSVVSLRDCEGDK